MFRYRRYRVFLVFAVITVFALYKFGTSSSSWGEDGTTSSNGQSKSDKEGSAQLNWQPNPQVAQETKKVDVDIPAAKSPQPLQTPPPIAPVSRPADEKPSTPDPAKPTPTPSLAGSGDKDNAVSPIAGQKPAGDEQSLQITPSPSPTSTVESIYWKKQSEHYPVPSKSLIKLPSGKPKSIPKIQFEFKQESTQTKADRETKLNVIREVFKRSWDGYKKYAWMQDELSPVSGNFRNPFASWGATLVDTLDTLWIMGLKEEFEEAVKAVDKIDFTTTQRADIPLFETTIRYLGGLIAAYDMSGKEHKNLLEKAVELAEILISAFDTPNRMPETYYYWRPAFASQSHRASNRVVLAEIGSLSVEFTALAQLTGEHKYYDAIARITDALEDFQDRTRLPGMWPTYLDASGCKKIDYSTPADTPLQAPLDTQKEAPKKSEQEELSPNGEKYIPLELPSPIVLTPNGANPTWQPEKEEPIDWPGPKETPKEVQKGRIKNWDDNPAHVKRQLDTEQPSKTQGSADALPVETENAFSHPECAEQGFTSSSDYGSEEYTLGGMSDSTYEYLPKEYLLLGGQLEKYRTMYEKSMDVVKKHLIFRPMLPNEDDILFSGKLLVPVKPYEDRVGDLEAENAHLTCFAGGMFGMGAKLFDRPEDLEIAKKLTEGCVWSYKMTSTGIMPEAFITVPCESTKACPWNETKYWEALDPTADTRFESYKQQISVYNEQIASASAWYESELAAMTSLPQPTGTAGGAEAVAEVEATPTPTVYADTLDKRQLADLEDDTPGSSSSVHSALPSASPSVIAEDRESVMGGESEEGEGPPTRVYSGANFEDVVPVASASGSPAMPAFPVIYSPKPPLTHKEYVKNRIQEERLPPGVTTIKARNYILRPEAIESVWYMYRITGDPYWREAGWQMFEAVNSHTAAIHGNSAIDDVTKTSPELVDEMESFWLAETLKYFYLLFTDEKTVSLDDWVLNTEAHPFRRPS